MGPAEFSGDCCMVKKDASQSSRISNVKFSFPAISTKNKHNKQQETLHTRTRVLYLNASCYTQRFSLKGGRLQIEHLELLEGCNEET